jgi:hypothetical protein
MLKGTNQACRRNGSNCTLLVNTHKVTDNRIYFYDIVMRDIVYYLADEKNRKGYICNDLVKIGLHFYQFGCALKL